MPKPLGTSFAGTHWRPEEELLFSSREGWVWVSWPNTEGAVKLGRHEAVAAMMRDFLAQDALGKRMSRR
jgi:hypothetical protein